MKTNNIAREAKQGGAALDAASYHIDPTQTVHVMQILRNMYARPEFAVFREYISNALDAHQYASVSERIEVHLPTFGSPHFSVRDFGGGLTIDQTKTLLLGYGSSGEHKRNSNNQIGGFGIGCKCAFSLCDAFTYTIYHGGFKRVWNCHLDEHDMGQATMQFEGASSERPGVEVTIPMKGVMQGDKKYENLLGEVFAFMDSSRHPKVLNPSSGFKLATPPPVLLKTSITGTVNGAEAKIEIQIVDKHAFSESFKDLRENPTLVVGGTAYKVDLKAVGFEVALDGIEHEDWEMRTALVRNAVVQAPIGFVQLAPSRESLQYSGATKKILHAVYATLLSDKVLKDLQSQIVSGNCTYMERWKKHQVAKLPVASDPWMNSAGFKVPVSLSKSLGYVKIIKHTYDYEWHRGALYNSDPVGNVNQYWPMGLMSNDSKIVVLEIGTAAKGEEKLKEYAAQVVTKLVQADKTLQGEVIVRMFESIDATIPWLADGSVDLVKDVTTLPEKDGALFANTHKSWGRGGRQSNAGPKNNYKQSARKFVKLGPTFKDPLSQCWEPCLAKDIDGGVYVKIDKYVISTPSGSVLDREGPYQELQNMFGENGKSKMDLAIADLLPQALVLLGVREGDVASVEKDPDFQTLWEYIYARFNEDFKAGKIDSDGFVAHLLQHCWSLNGTAEAKEASKLWFEFAISAGKRDNIAKTELGKRLKWWVEAADNSSIRTKQWAKFLASLGQALGNSGSRGGQDLLIAILWAADPVTKKSLVDWSLLTGKDADFLKDMIKNKTSLRIGLRGTKNKSRLSSVLTYVLENHPVVAQALGLGSLFDALRGQSTNYSANGYEEDDGTPVKVPTTWTNINSGTLGSLLLKQESFYTFVELVEKEKETKENE